MLESHNPCQTHLILVLFFVAENLPDLRGDKCTREIPLTVESCHTGPHHQAYPMRYHKKSTKWLRYSLQGSRWGPCSFTHSVPLSWALIQQVYTVQRLPPLLLSWWSACTSHTRVNFILFKFPSLLWLLGNSEKNMCDLFRENLIYNLNFMN